MYKHTHGVMTGGQIASQVNYGKITIDPFSESQLNPASYDLRLGDEVCVYEAAVRVSDRPHNIPEGVGGRELAPATGVFLDPLDSKRDNPVLRYTIPAGGWLVKPGIGYLMHTKERVTTKHFVPVLDGKSSIGRLFVKVHETAGYGDPGFDGQYTLEVTAMYPVILYPGMRICQVRFHTIYGTPNLYEGHYRGENTMGAIPSRTWEQFRDDR